MKWAPSLVLFSVILLSITHGDKGPINVATSQMEAMASNTQINHPQPKASFLQEILQWILSLVWGNDESGDDNGDKCMTDGGADPNKPCIFPLKFNGGTHYACIWDPMDSSAAAWCSTKVDDQGNHIGGQGNWGNCGSDCLTSVSYTHLTLPTIYSV